MRYTLTWSPDADDQLTELWLAAANRDALTNAASQIDAQLRADPKSAGESRDADVRILSVPPLSVYYNILEDDRKVVVWAVWISSKPKD